MNERIPAIRPSGPVRSVDGHHPGGSRVGSIHKKKKATKPTRDGRASAKSRRLHASSSSTLRRVRVCGARDGKHAFILGDIVGM